MQDEKHFKGKLTFYQNIITKYNPKSIIQF